MITEVLNNIRAIYGLDPIEEQSDEASSTQKKSPQQEPASKCDSTSLLNLKFKS